MHNIIHLSKAVILALFLPILGALSSAATITIEMQGGMEKELTVDVPARFAGKSDQYVKWYAQNYMLIWNHGMGSSPKADPYRYDIALFARTTPPRVVDSDVAWAIKKLFGEENFRLKRKIEIDAQDFLRDKLYTGDDKTTEKVLKNIGGMGRKLNLTVPIPPKYASRADEYAKAYAIRYMEHWNEVLGEKAAEKPELGSMLNRFSFGLYLTQEPFVSVGVEKAVEKHFEEQGVYAEVEKALEDYLKTLKKK